jgi:murein DD-endopeptidase MepM/ murein hydrolase activator NlpD
MNSVYVRRRSTRHGGLNKNNTHNISIEKITNNLIRQLIICCAIFILIIGIKNINTSFTNAIVQRVSSLIKYTISINEAYKSVQTFATNSGIYGIGKLNSNLYKTQGAQITDDNSNAPESSYGSLSMEPFEIRPLIDEGEVKIPKNVIVPVKGIITSRFGTRTHPLFNKELFHSGVDIDAPIGTEVQAVLDGEVVKIENNETYGRFVKVAHSDELYSVYAHLNETSVKIGRKIRRGETVGKLGNTGKTSGAHLHFELWRRDKVVDPMKYLNFENRGES